MKLSEIYLHFYLECPRNSSFSEKDSFVPLLQNCKINYPLISLFSKIPKCTLIFNDTLTCFAEFKASALRLNRYARIQLPYRHIKMRCFQRSSVLSSSGFLKGSRQILSAGLICEVDLYYQFIFNEYVLSKLLLQVFSLQQNCLSFYCQAITGHPNWIPLQGN